MPHPNLFAVLIKRPELRHRGPVFFARLTRALVCLGLGAGLGMIGTTIPAKAQAGFYPKGTNLSSLVVISDGNLTNSAQKVLIATLQGLVARQAANQIFIDDGNGYTYWYEHLNTAYGIPYTVATSPYTVLTQFKPYISGYVLYNKSANSNSVNAATSLCGLLNAVAVDASIETAVNGCGVTNRLADVRTATDASIWSTYGSQLNHSLVMEQKTSFDEDLRDYAAMVNGYMFFEGNNSFRNSIVSQMNGDAACLGWGDASSGENVFVGDSSSNGVFTVAADYAFDISTLSSIRDASVFQHTYNTNPVPETNVHYVTFIMSDGDNVQWNLGGEPPFYSSSVRGSFNMGWSLSPSLADLAPSVLRWHYDYASTTPHRDVFVASPSGAGYMYPSLYPPADLDVQVAKLNDFMGRADMNIDQIIDFNSFARLDLWNKYLAQTNINGLLYLEYTSYSGLAGAVEFSTNGKPVIACRNALNSGSNPTSAINGYPRDPSSPLGYTFVCVTVWDDNLANVQQVVTNLSSDVRVVAPDVFMRLIRDNVGRKLSYDFGTSLQGWAGATSGKFYDKAVWTNALGNPPGALLMDGSDLGVSDSQPNSWFTRQVILPKNATTLGFDTMAANDGLLRVRLQPPAGATVVLIDWQGLPAPNVWANRTVDISAYAGQTVTLLFEQNDGGQGSGEYRYVDNVSILSSGPAVYVPDAPKLLSAAGLTNVVINWRDNGENESGFLLERSAAGGASWSQIASISSNLTSYADNTAQPGQNYLYRLRSWNAAGGSLYSNIQTNTIPPLRYPLGPANGRFEAGASGWNTGGTGGAGGSAIYSNPLTNGLSESGTNCVLMTSDGTGTVDIRADHFSLGSSIDGAKSVTFSFDYNFPGTIKSGNQIRVGLRFEDASGGFLGEYNSYVGTSHGDVGGSGWKHFTVSAVPVATALSADIRISMNVFGDDTWSSGPMLFDNLLVISGTDSVLNATNIVLGTIPNTPVTRAAAGGQLGAVDADGDPLNISNLGQPAHGVTTTDGASITYLPNNGYTGSDQFSFVISDGLGRMATNRATVVVNGSAGLNHFSQVTTAGAGNYVLSFNGAPFCQYILEWTGSLNRSTNNWVPVLTNTANALGAVTFTNSQAQPSGFWRTQLRP